MGKLDITAITAQRLGISMALVPGPCFRNPAWSGFKCAFHHKMFAAG